jgi:hypothetical protein
MMKTVAALLALFLVVGVFASKVNGKVRLILLLPIAGAVLYTSLH